MRLQIVTAGSLLILLQLAWVSAPAPARAQGQTPAAAPASAVKIVEDHERSLIQSLTKYLTQTPGAEDREQAYMVIFEKSIANDWYAESEGLAREYLAGEPEGPVAPMARIITTMAQAKAGRFTEALIDYQALMRGISQPDQEEFAVNFADTLAEGAAQAGQQEIARKVYETLQERFPDSPNLKQKVADEQKRLALIGTAAPDLVIRDLGGKTLKLSDYRGRYVLVDFWATWCAPCVADLPGLQKVYQELVPRKVEIISVSLDENSQAVSDFVSSRRVPWPQVHHASGGADLVAAFGVSSIPASYLIGPDGKILRLNLKSDSLRKAIEELSRR